VSESSNLEMEQAGETKSDTPMDEAIEITTAPTPTSTETVGTNCFQAMEIHKNGKWTRRSEAPSTTLATSDWKSRMERNRRQQAQ